MNAVDCLRKIVAEADANPFNPIGHVIEHVVPQTREALAASEPVEAVDNIATCVHRVIDEGDGWWQPCSGCYETEDGQAVGKYPYSAAFRCALGDGCSECGGLGAVWFQLPSELESRADFDSAKPAPEQPGKGEAVAWMRKTIVYSDKAEGRAPGERIISERKVYHDDIPLTYLYPRAARQLSDPAEGDAVRKALIAVRDRFFPADQPERLRDLLWDEVNAALSTPPTAAVRIDAADLLFVGFDKNSEHRLFRMRETAERHCIGEIKTYAALDPQVKR